MIPNQLNIGAACGGGFVLDYDTDGNLVGIDIDNARTKSKWPRRFSCDQEIGTF